MLSRNASRSSTLRMRTMSARSSRETALHAESALADRVDEAARDKPRQRLAQRRRADAVARRRLGDAEARYRERARRRECRLRSAAAARSAQRIGARSHQGRTSLSRSGAPCSMSCCFMVSTHQARSAPFNSGLATSGAIQAHELDRHLGEFRDRLRWRPFAVGIDDRRRLRDRIAERLDDLGMRLGEACASRHRR